MFLYRQIAHGHDMVQLVEDFDEACEKARTFVGEHSDIDSCSGPRQERQTEMVYRTYRGTSFGARRATVRPIFSDRPVGLD